MKSKIFILTLLTCSLPGIAHAYKCAGSEKEVAQCLREREEFERENADNLARKPAAVTEAAPEAGHEPNSHSNTESNPQESSPDWE